MRYAVCTSCTHIFIDPPPTDEWLADFYAREFRFLYNATAAPDEHYLSTHTPEHMGAHELADRIQYQVDGRPTILE